ASEASEIIWVCDRAYVMYQGVNQGEVTGENLTEHQIMKLATGGVRTGARGGEKTMMENTIVKNIRKFFHWFKYKWSNEPLFSTAVALMIMIILQTLVLGFDYDSFGHWFKSWTNNWMNILRNNAGIGIIALGMTFVIMTGGIDLAVGSMLAAAGAFTLVLLDTGPNGILSIVGLTGVSAFIVAIILVLLLGYLLGLLTGVVITKGNVPPFIATLGTMMIFRSVTQHFMQGS